MYCRYIRLLPGQVSIRNRGDTGKKLLIARGLEMVPLTRQLARATLSRWESDLRETVASTIQMDQFCQRLVKYSSAIGRRECIIGLED